jgi:hypothetical protein
MAATVTGRGGRAKCSGFSIIAYLPVAPRTLRGRWILASLPHLFVNGTIIGVCRR